MADGMIVPVNVVLNIDVGLIIKLTVVEVEGKLVVNGTVVSVTVTGGTHPGFVVQAAIPPLEHKL